MNNRYETIKAYVKYMQSDIVELPKFENWLKKQGKSVPEIKSIERALRYDSRRQHQFARKIEKSRYQVLAVDFPLITYDEPVKILTPNKITVIPGKSRDEWDIETFNEVCGSLSNINALPLVCPRCGNIFTGSLYVHDVNPYAKKFHRGKRVQLGAECPRCTQFEQ